MYIFPGVCRSRPPPFLGRRQRHRRSDAAACGHAEGEQGQRRRLESVGWSSTRAARMALALPLSLPRSHRWRVASQSRIRKGADLASLVPQAIRLHRARWPSRSLLHLRFTGAFEHCLNALQRTRSQRERQRAIQLAVISKLKTLSASGVRN